MSVESTALSRSKLEQKDRSELAAIVEAMGGKAASRAKKADLVDLVLTLAGASNGAEKPAKAAPAKSTPKSAPATEADPTPEPIAQEEKQSSPPAAADEE